MAHDVLRAFYHGASILAFFTKQILLHAMEQAKHAESPILYFDSMVKPLMACDRAKGPIPEIMGRKNPHVIGVVDHAHEPLLLPEAEELVVFEIRQGFVGLDIQLFRSCTGRSLLPELR